MAVLSSPPSKWKLNADGDIQPKSLTANLRIEKVTPSLILRDIFQVLPDGLWRTRLDNSNILFIEKNTAVAGDFSIFASPMFMSSTVVSVQGILDLLPGDGGIPGRIAFDSSTTELSIDPHQLYRNAVDERLHYKVAVADDRSIAYQIDDLNHQISNPDPAFELRETDQILPAGLWRTRLGGNAFKVERNTAPVGDWSSFQTPFDLSFDGIQYIFELGGQVDVGTNLLLSGASSYVWFVGTVPTPTVNNTLFRSSADTRLHFRNNSAVNKTLAYLDEVAAIANFITRETPTGTVNGVNTIFTLANTPVVGSESVYLNGVQQDPGGANDYTIAGATITFNVAPLTGEKIRVSYIKA